MRIATLILIIILAAVPCMAGPSPDRDHGRTIAADNGNGKERRPDNGERNGHGGKVIIKGKDGKVTDVRKKPHRKQ